VAQHGGADSRKKVKMIQQILDYINLAINNARESLVATVISLLVSFVLGFLIYYVYTKSFKGVVFNHGFSVSLALMTILTAVITTAVSSNIALSLGMLGSLSIVRYRAAVKEPMDLLFLFWAITIGITSGAKMYVLAVLTMILMILMIIFISTYTPISKMYIMLLHYTGGDIDSELRRILHERHYQIKSKTIRTKDVELAAEIRINNNNLSFLDKVKELPSVSDVTLVEYTGNYNG
jgi:hypothetical protein